MRKIAVIGEAESVIGFSSIGLETFPVTSVKDAEEKLIQLSKNNYGVIYVTESVAKDISDIIDKFNAESTPAIILIPGIRDNTGIGMKKIEKSIEKAVGTQLLD